MSRLLCLLLIIWDRLPYPLTHLHQCLNTSHEWHTFILGFCFPAVVIWRMRHVIEEVKLITREGTVPEAYQTIAAELHYFMAGVMLSTVLMFAAAAAYVWVMVHG